MHRVQHKNTAYLNQISDVYKLIITQIGELITYGIFKFKLLKQRPINIQQKSYMYVCLNWLRFFLQALDKVSSNLVTLR